MAIAFDRTPVGNYGVAVPCAPGLRRVLANNPGPFTFGGTGTYIVGEGEVAVIDPGPLQHDHVEALLQALDGEQVTHILVTHTHPDHSPAAAPLKAATGATIYGFGPHAIAGDGEVDEGALEEVGDADFRPDVAVRDGDVIEGRGFSFECLHTPGHTSNHVCFAHREAKALFCGDHVMGWATTVILPPDGSMRAYVDNLERLLTRDDAVYWPTHGQPIRDPKPFVRDLIAHRRAREAQIVACLADGVERIPDMVARIYADVDRRLHAAAARSVFAHLIGMVERGEVLADPGLSASARYTLRTG